MRKSILTFVLAASVLHADASPPTGAQLRDHAAAAYLSITSNKISEVTQLFSGNTAIVYAQYFPEQSAGAIYVVRMEIDLGRVPTVRTDFVSACDLASQFQRGNGVLQVASGAAPFSPFCDVAAPQNGWYANVHAGAFLAAVSTVMRMHQSQAGYVQIGLAKVGAGGAAAGDEWVNGTGSTSAKQGVRASWYVAQGAGSLSVSDGYVLRPQFDSIGCSGALCARLQTGTGYVFARYRGGNMNPAQGGRDLANDTTSNVYGPITLHNAFAEYFGGGYREGASGSQQGAAFAAKSSTELGSGGFVASQGSASALGVVAGNALSGTNSAVTANQRAGVSALTTNTAFFSALYGAAQAGLALQRASTAFDATNAVVQSGVNSQGAVIPPRSP